METRDLVEKKDIAVEALPVDRTRGWIDKFRDAIRGVHFVATTEKSLVVHVLAATAVIAVGAFLRVSAFEWAILSVCIAVVIAAEVFNSALESLAKAVTREDCQEVGNALDAAAGAVLLVAIGAAAAGLWVFVPHCREFVIASW